MLDTEQNYQLKKFNFLPSWFRQNLPDISKINKMKSMFRDQALATVCESAHCPNMGKCWGQGVATFMILGKECTRSCRFCAVASGQPQKVDNNEPERVAQMIKELGLKYVVITSVTRDDLNDEGADQFVKTVKSIRKHNPKIKIELLIPDFSARPELINRVVDMGPEVIGHNIEMAERLFSEIRPQARFHRSLDVLRIIKKKDPQVLVKSGFMVGLGENDQEIASLLKDLRGAGCDMLTIGQYLSPSQGKRHIAVDRFVSPKKFDEYKKQALAMGFKHVLSGPLVRSSYIAETGYQECMNNS